MRTSTPVLVDAVPVASAIGAFGIVFGATASTVIGPAMTLASSVLLFSGAAQFTMVSLIDAGESAPAVAVAIAVLSVRHLPLAAIVGPRLRPGRLYRAALGLVLTDETAGLAVASARPAARTLAVVGIAAYGAWVVGTAAGVAGAELVAAAPLASLVFVLLFIGLAAMTSRSGADTVRAASAAVATGALLLAFPAAGAGGAIVVALACAGTTVCTR